MQIEQLEEERKGGIDEKEKERRQWIPQRSHRVCISLNLMNVAVGPGEIAPTAINYGAFFGNFFFGNGNFQLFLNGVCHVTSLVATSPRWGATSPNVWKNVGK